MMDGKIKTLARDRGFGFITSDDGTEWFFHTSGCEKGDFETFKVGERVSFKPTKSPKGARAENVSRV